MDLPSKLSLTSIVAFCLTILLVWMPTPMNGNRLSIHGVDENDSISEEDKHDLAWEKHNQLVFDLDSYNATASLLELYGCTIYSDEFGIEPTDSDSAVSTTTTTTTTMSTAAYSRIPTDDDAWTLFEDAYRFAVGKEPLPRTSETMQHEMQRRIFPASRGMQIPFEVRYDPTIGRSVHTTEFVPKGTLIWTSSHVVAFTKDEEEALSSKLPKYRRFLEYLYNHSTNSSSRNGNGNGVEETYNWACDALMWTFLSGEGVCMSFDHGSMFNDAKENKTAVTIDTYECTEKFEHNGVVPNALSEAVDMDCLCLDMHAYRDIMPGEELRYDYNETLSEDDDEKYEDQDDAEYKNCDNEL